MRSALRCLLFVVILFPSLFAQAHDTKETAVYARLKAYLDSVPGIDTHSHMRGPRHLEGGVFPPFEGEKPTNCALHACWRSSYFIWGHHLTPWPADGKFETWWAGASKDFANSRARSAYRSLLPVFRDLYGVEFDGITLEEARALNERMEANFVDPDWAEEVIRRRANTELMVVDQQALMPRPEKDSYPFQVYVCNTQRLVNGFHPSETRRWPGADPYVYAAQHELPLESIDDYVALMDRIFADAKAAGAVCLKNPSAYDRTLLFERTPKHLAEEAFGKPRSELRPDQVKAFQDYVFWKIAELSAKHELPFQIHTGHAQIEGSNPLNLVPVISAHPNTRFILFHGGFPWVGDAGMVALRYPNVYLDSVWLPALSYTMARRALKEWLDMIASNRIMWGSDMFPIEGTYGATMVARRCIAEALAEKVIAKELREEDARRIGRQILRENALEAIPALREHLDPRAREHEGER